MTNDVVDDACDGCGGIEHNTVSWKILARAMQSLDELPLLRFSAPLTFTPLVEPPLQGVTVDVKDENFIEQLDESREVPRTPAEERHRLITVGNEGANFLQMPDVVLVGEAVQRFTGDRITLIGQLGVTVDRVVAASTQLPEDGGLSRAGHAFNQVIPDPHARC